MNAEAVFILLFSRATQRWGKRLHKSTTRSRTDKHGSLGATSGHSSLLYMDAAWTTVMTPPLCQNKALQSCEYDYPVPPVELCLGSARSCKTSFVAKVGFVFQSLQKLAPLPPNVKCRLGQKLIAYRFFSGDILAVCPGLSIRGQGGGLCQL